MRAGSGFLLACLIHLVLLVLLVLAERRPPTEPATAVALPPTPRRGGGGGGGAREVYISPRQAPPAVTPVPVPVSVPKVVRPPVPVAPVPVAAAPAPTPAPEAVAPSSGGVGTGAGAGSGTGSGTGQGSGTGSGAGAGTGPAVDSASVTIVPPVWRSGAIPLDSPPGPLRGQSVTVTFAVRSDGRVERVEVKPLITDDTYARVFGEMMREFRFVPAHTLAGVNVAATTTLTFKLPTR